MSPASGGAEDAVAGARQTFSLLDGTRRGKGEGKRRGKGENKIKEGEWEEREGTQKVSAEC